MRGENFDGVSECRFDDSMAFTEDEIATFTEQIERIIWTHRRPPLHLRNMVREGQSIEGQEIEIFEERPYFRDKTQWIKSRVAKTRYVRSRNVWKVYWRRGDGKWHPYNPCPETASLEEWLHLVNQDEHGCFWG
jgi:hypothetical protein